ncbi:response regulator [Pseudoduganella albidiflava]|uniref:DNA-binding response regulator n=1 Tax=Pseudoduganella albidiflava TaxID=321983 RepID=A0A411X106_9BURK|nr:response regulator transcription factor [Pseudoduganella albidiflava]QBI02650.1 response regulator transcription factor [Pseudoduganella albidiflava]GGY40981.1 DNA-binding response regulator [Pseudoduganella albidiflava]
MTIRIMLVDDHKTMLWGLERLIQAEAPAFTLVASASDAAEAVALCALHAPDIVLLDLDLKGSSSLDILPALVANGATRVVILSANRDHATLASAVKLGARGVVSKESPTEDVLAAVRKVHGGELWLDQPLMQALLGQLVAPAPAANPEAQRIASLTSREREVIGMIVQGNGALNKELAERAFISERTLRNHLTAIYGKLNVANRLELYMYATRHGLG